jgi:tetratricopeptide (TPR) repeat protein
MKIGITPPGFAPRPRKKSICFLASLVLLAMAGQAQTFRDLYDKGLASYQKGEYAEAEGCFEKALTFGIEKADVYYFLGMCAAFQGRPVDAERALLSAIAINPSLKECYVEVGGLYFKQKKFTASERALKKALKLDAGDAYAIDLLGTIYFINGLQERALAQWNKVDRPVLNQLVLAGEGIKNRELAEKELCFRPGQLVRPSQIRATRKRLSEIDCYSGISFSLAPSAADLDQMDLIVSGNEQRGFGALAAVLTGGLRDLPHQTAYVNFKNFTGHGLNLYSAYRWDKYQQKVGLALRVPRLLGTPFYYQLSYRDQNDRWSFRAPDDPLEGEEFTQSERELRLDVDHLFNNGVRLDHHLRIKRTSSLSLTGGESPAAETVFLWGGDYAVGLVESVDKRLTTDLSLSYDISAPNRVNPKRSYQFVLAADVAKSWAPGLSQDYTGRFRARMAWGSSTSNTPFGEFFVLGLGPDVRHQLRAYRTTEGGKLGHSPLGREFVLLNLDYLHRLGRLSIVRIDGGLFFDGGRILDENSFNQEFGNALLADCGICLVAHVFHVSFQVSYAHSLNSKRQALYISSILE